MYIAIDIGGTNVRIAVSQSLHDPTFSDIRRFRVKNDYEHDIHLIMSTINDMRQGQSVNGIGCCFAGPISNEKDAILGSPNVPDWIGKPFVRDLSDEFKCNVFLENDAACAALGEAIYGQGRRKDFLFLIWGTGFGGTAVTQTGGDMQVRPMEAGHTILVWDSNRICGCGQTGCAEAYLGGVNIHKYLGKLAEDLTEEEWEAVYEHMAHAVINVLATNYKPLIIFGGGIAVNQQKRLAKIEEVLQKRIRIYPAPAIRLTEHADNIGLLGCLALCSHAITAQDTKKRPSPFWFRRHPHTSD